MNGMMRGSILRAGSRVVCRLQGRLSGRHKDASTGGCLDGNVAADEPATIRLHVCSLGFVRTRYWCGPSPKRSGPRWLNIGLARKRRRASERDIAHPESPIDDVHDDVHVDAMCRGLVAGCGVCCCAPRAASGERPRRDASQALALCPPAWIYWSARASNRPFTLESPLAGKLPGGALPDSHPADFGLFIHAGAVGSMVACLCASIQWRGCSQSNKARLLPLPVAQPFDKAVAVRERASQIPTVQHPNTRRGDDRHSTIPSHLSNYCLSFANLAFVLGSAPFGRIHHSPCSQGQTAHVHLPAVVCTTATETPAALPPAAVVMVCLLLRGACK